MEIIISNDKKKNDQLRKQDAREKKMAEAGELFKLQIEEMSDMRKKMKKAKEVKEQEVRLCKLWVCWRSILFYE